MKGVGISVKPPTNNWKDMQKYDRSIIVYDICTGKVFGGLHPKRTVNEVARDSSRYHPGGDFTMELDLSNRTFAMETNGVRIIIDDNISDFQYSPIVVLHKNVPQVTLI